LLTFSSIVDYIPASSQTLFIGYSGGVDSQVLLHLLASQAHLQHRIVALYVHHGLQADADDWALHCEKQCQQLSVSFRLLVVNAKPNVGESPEEAARNARYSVFRQLIKPGDVLLIAQHREDQLETVLLQLFRGAGPNGLAAMPVSNSFGQGALIRPFLNIPKSSILHYANYHQLSWVEDPSNGVDDFDRNFLRNQIIPTLRLRWPSLDKTVARSAQLCADSADLIRNWANSVILQVVDPVDHCLLITEWRLFDYAQRQHLLRYWLQGFGLRSPSQVVLQSIMEQVIDARADSAPQLIIQQHQIRKYRDKLYCLGEDKLLDGFQLGKWKRGALFYNLGNGFQLALVEGQVGIPKYFWLNNSVTIDKRRGGERLQLSNRQGRHYLKKLFQESGIPPWQRENNPLLFIDGVLAFVPDLGIDQRFLAAGVPCYQIIRQKITELPSD
jgi:tRNA(Ile)-lysidine synthase